MTANYEVRRADLGDLRFVVKSWLDSYRPSHSAGMLSNTPVITHCRCGAEIDVSFASVMPPTVLHLLARKNVTTYVAADDTMMPPNNLLGFLVVERNPQVPAYKPPLFKLELRTSPHPLVHYVLVKKTFRGWGVARALFKAAGVDPAAEFLYTCTTPISESIRKARKVPRAIWEPSCARFTHETSTVHDQERTGTAVQLSRADATPVERHGRRDEGRKRGL